MDGRQSLLAIAGVIAFCLTLSLTLQGARAGEGDDKKDGSETPKEETKKDGLYLPSAMNGLKMGMSAQEIQTIRKEAKDLFGNLQESPNDVKDLCSFFGIQETPTEMRIKYFCKDKGLNSIYISFEYRGDSAKRDQELTNLKAALTKGLGEPNGSKSSGSWDKPGLFYSFSSGVAGSDGYWFAYQIDKK